MIFLNRGPPKITELRGKAYHLREFSFPSFPSMSSEVLLLLGTRLEEYFTVLTIHSLPLVFID